jgi:uncharacterized membrane protein (UPF0127 family)
MNRLGVTLAVAAALGLGACAPPKKPPPPPPTVPSAPALATHIATALANAGPAESPFAGMTETDLTVGGQTLRVVIADEHSERSTGLREAAPDLGPYDGMLFVFPGTTTNSFTMSGVAVALDIGWYDASGGVVASTTMQPCSCTYSAGAPYRLAIETLEGNLPEGPIT